MLRDMIVALFFSNNLQDVERKKLRIEASQNNSRSSVLFLFYCEMTYRLRTIVDTFVFAHSIGFSRCSLHKAWGIDRTRSSGYWLLHRRTFWDRVADLCTSSQSNYSGMVMVFSDIRRSVIWLLLVDLLPNVKGQPVVALSSSDVYCPVERLESRLASIEDQVNRLQRMVLALTNPLIKGDYSGFLK